MYEPNQPYPYNPQQHGFQPMPPQPDNYLVWAILATIFCFLPFGILAIVKASEVNSKWNVGDYVGARLASDEARKWVKWSVLTSVIFTVVVGGIYVIVMVIAFAMANVGN